MDNFKKVFFCTLILCYNKMRSLISTQTKLEFLMNHVLPKYLNYNPLEKGMSMKIFIKAIITILILVFLNTLASKVLKVHFLELAMFIGYAAAIMVFFFTTSGGFTSRALDLEIQSKTGLKMVEKKRGLKLTIPFLTSLSYGVLFTIIAFIIYH